MWRRATAFSGPRGSEAESGLGASERAESEGEERGASSRLQVRGWVDGERDTAKQEVAQRLRARGDHASVLLSREEDDREAVVVGGPGKELGRHCCR